MDKVKYTAGVLILSGLFGSGCSTMEPPQAEFYQAKADVETATAESASEFAALAMHNAKEKIERAKKAMDAEEYPEAKRLAEQASADAQLAKVTAQTEKMKEALEEVNASLETLKSELKVSS
ncbi:DUF4398 domain-containing protein [Ketobacter sp. MCCC 1A13808]|uniref:DUF4398 domain-containing protein n=1 Tax=Ketobacter sp. MCCC 1A13808 TaxID=2602738 RepID=UPI000F25B46F|nr:DUF4398 domain-containing protein [Ketobacter sp. MCCC 1A13808]MVF12394.1 DUF4398 domain-containing protein [Ketobacter sp. MCCC 1A13808]RLP55790.1 MAG: DUF4398 domain-containing protein [Ketobacter sp.]